MIGIYFLLISKCFSMDLTQILTMSAMQGGESVDPMQIMLMTQLLKDDDGAEGEEEGGQFVVNFKIIHTNRSRYGHDDHDDDDEWRHARG